MRNRSQIPKAIVNKLLVESRHRCNVCRRDVAQIHHIDQVDSKKGNEESNLIVLCPDCHRRAHLPASYFERRLTSIQLKQYKKGWVSFCKKFPNIAVEKPVLVYSFLNRPRIESLFNQIAHDAHRAVIDYLKNSYDKNFVASSSLEKMMQVVINRMDFFDLEIVKIKENYENLGELEGKAVYYVSDFYAHGLKSRHYYVKHGVKEFPYIFHNEKVNNKKIMIKVTYDPKFIISDTGYVELSGHHRLSFYGIVKRVALENKSCAIEIMPLAIGPKHALQPYNAYIRNLTV